MDKRRNFIKKTAVGALGLSFFNFRELLVSEEECSTEEILEFLANCNDRSEYDYVASVLYKIKNAY